MVVDGLGQDSIAAIEEEYDEGSNRDEGYELNARPYLKLSVDLLVKA